MHIADFQHAVMLWMEKCFGQATDGRKKPVRNLRFYEEATELVQAAGMTREEAHRQVDYTFDRPAGDPAQELGGVMVVLAAWAGTYGFQMSECGPAELLRIDTPELIAKVRAAQASKPKPGESTPQTHEAAEDHRRLVRELDVLLNGSGAARQASLCDIVSQVQRERIRSRYWSA